MHIFNAEGSARYGPVPFMKKTQAPEWNTCVTFTETTDQPFTTSRPIKS